jgi:hypothetical protein
MHREGGYLAEVLIVRLIKGVSSTLSRSVRSNSWEVAYYKFPFAGLDRMNDTS